MALLTDEQKMLGDMAREWAQNEAPVKRFRTLRDTGGEAGHDPAIWAEMTEMGWPGVLTAEEHGGSGFGYRAAGLILEQLGRSLVVSPLLSSLSVSGAINLTGSAEQKAAWLPRLADGSCIPALAIDDGPHHIANSVETSATLSNDGWEINGTKLFVADAMQANLYLVGARSEDGLQFFLVPADAPGISRQRRAMADSRDFGCVSFTGVKVERDALLNAGSLRSTSLRTSNCIYSLIAAEMLGVIDASFAMTLEYLKTRVQFGQVIGTFQALQHRASEMFCQIELARSAVQASLEALDHGVGSPELASLAKGKTNDVLKLVTREMIQMHGGIGMTDEHDSGLYLKRAGLLEAMWGNSSYHRRRYAALTGI